MYDAEKRKHLIKVARISINSSLVFIVFGLILGFLLDHPEILSSDEPSVQLTAVEEINPDYSVDPKEIENGIHVPSGLIAQEGFELVLGNCVQCHSINLVKQNRATEQGWLEMIHWMQETQGLWDLGENESEIVRYLSTYYAPENTGRRKNLENIEWYKL